MCNILELANECDSLNEICRKFFGKANYTNREKVKELLREQGIKWDIWLNEKKKNKERYCLTCGKKLKRGQKKYCSHSCSAKMSNPVRKIERKNYCIECGKKLEHRQTKFCSTKCERNYLYKDFIKRWKSGEENGMKGEYGTSAHIRRYLFEKNNCKCELCGWGKRNEYTNTVPLEVHHIDGNYQNNKEENLQLLCPNCHSLTDTAKSHNKNGRRGRKKYES